MCKFPKITRLITFFALLSVLLSGCASQSQRDSTLTGSTLNRYLQTSLNNLSAAKDVSLYLSFKGSKLGNYSNILNNLSFSILYDGTAKDLSGKSGGNAHLTGDRAGTAVSEKLSLPHWIYEYNVFYANKALLHLISDHQGYFLVNLDKKNIEALSKEGQTLINPEILYMASLAGNAWYKVSLRQLREALSGVSSYVRIALPNDNPNLAKKPKGGLSQNVIGLIADALIAAVAPSGTALTNGFSVAGHTGGILVLDTSANLENILTDWIDAFDRSRLALPSFLLGSLKTLSAKLPPIDVGVGISLLNHVGSTQTSASHRPNFYLHSIVESAKSGLARIVINTSLAYTPVDISGPKDIVNIPGSLWTLLRFSLDNILQRYL